MQYIYVLGVAHYKSKIKIQNGAICKKRYFFHIIKRITKRNSKLIYGDCSNIVGIYVKCQKLLETSLLLL